MSWTDEWIGLPHEKLGRGPKAYDCIGLYLRLYLLRFGVTIPDPHCSPSEAVRNRVVDQLRPSFRSIARSDVSEGDALLFFAGTRALHLGYALDATNMLHSERDFSCIERWTGSRWIGRLEGIYRFA